MKLSFEKFHKKLLCRKLNANQINHLSSLVLWQLIWEPSLRPTGTDREQSNFFVASDILYCYLLHVYRSVCFTRAQGPNDHWIYITIISNVVIINHENNSHLLFFVCHPCRVQTQDLPDHMFSNFIKFSMFFCNVRVRILLSLIHLNLKFLQQSGASW